jgi:16S rRNA (uracil1498-N3)-methyltransferase
MMPKCRHDHSAQFMRLTRCYVPAPLYAGDTLSLPEGTSSHIGRVLRARVGESLTLFDGRGGEYGAQILNIDRRSVRVRIGDHRQVERESPLRVTLLQAQARAERMDFVVQKATELGVAAIIVLPGERSVVRLDAQALHKRCEHWRAVAISACEQCGRNRVPTIESVPDLSAGCARAPAEDLRVLLAPEAGQPLLTLIAAATSVSLLIGPEGGFDAEELALAVQHGFQSARLGPRVLRAETAPLAALAVIQASAGDLAL